MYKIVVLPVKRIVLSRFRCRQVVGSSSPQVMLHGTIRNDDFQHNTSMQCCNHSKQCHCCNAVLCWKSSLPIVSCHITLIMTCIIDFHCRPREVAVHTIRDNFLCGHEKRSSIVWTQPKKFNSWHFERESLIISKFTPKDGKTLACDKRDRAITYVFCRHLLLTLMFSGLLRKDLFEGKWSLAKSYFKQNYCHACHTRFAVFFLSRPVA